MYVFVSHIFWQFFKSVLLRKFYIWLISPKILGHVLFIILSLGWELVFGAIIILIHKQVPFQTDISKQNYSDSTACVHKDLLAFPYKYVQHTI